MAEDSNRTVILLGPQRLRPTLVQAVRGVGVTGDVAVVTAGWQEREEEVDELREHLGGRVTNLQLYARAEQVFDEDADLARALRQRQDRLRRMQEVYRLRLGYALDAARALLTRRGDPELLVAEREAAIEAIREIDRAHLARVAAVHREIDEQWKPFERPAIARHREEIARLLDGCAAFAIAGGHVAVLLNRLRLFGVAELVAGKPVFAWSGGAMVAGEQLVLFHDDPPQGAGNAEVLEAGLGLYRGLLPLPHAGRRLDLDEPLKVALFARRFAGMQCVALDDRVILRCEAGQWHPWSPGAHEGEETAHDRARQLLPDGTVAELDAA
jgi:hypothetical protein